MTQPNPVLSKMFLSLHLGFLSKCLREGIPAVLVVLLAHEGYNVGKGHPISGQGLSNAAF